MSIICKAHRTNWIDLENQILNSKNHGLTSICMERFQIRPNNIFTSRKQNTVQCPDLYCKNRIHPFYLQRKSLIQRLN
jgi:hypothetical protein